MDRRKMLWPVVHKSFENIVMDFRVEQFAFDTIDLFGEFARCDALWHILC